MVSLVVGQSYWPPVFGQGRGPLAVPVVELLEWPEAPSSEMDQASTALWLSLPDSRRGIGHWGQERMRSARGARLYRQGSQKPYYGELVRRTLLMHHAKLVSWKDATGHRGLADPGPSLLG